MPDLRTSEKANRYISLLENARCNGRWQEVPELARKVGKHAPHRECLRASAQAECQIVAYNKKALAGSGASPLQQLIPSLTKAIQKEKESSEDAFQAQSCLGWLTYAEGRYTDALAALPSSFPLGYSAKEATSSGMTGVCLIRNFCLRGAIKEKLGKPEEALETYEQGLDSLISLSESQKDSSESRMWMERFLGGYCMALSNSESSGLDTKTQEALRPERKLAPFRSWSKYLQAGKTTGTVPNVQGEALIGQRQVWLAYYATISNILGSGKSMFTDSCSNDGDILGEIRQVETKYEGLLLKEVSFPEAKSANLEVENWVEQVMRNWQILCSPQWADRLGKSGREGLSRRIIEVSLSALSSYFEIIKKAKVREEKAGEYVPGLDSNEVLLNTTCEAIDMLCQFGGADESLKSHESALFLETWLKDHPSDEADDGTGVVTNHERNSKENRANVHIAGHLRARVYQAIGTSYAQWARFTFDSAKRSELRQQAIRNLKTALSSHYGDEENSESLYALAFVYAESRDLENAITCAKMALSGHVSKSPNLTASSYTLPSSPLQNISENAHLLKIWHLLALLLSARQDFRKALEFCEVALEDVHDDDETPQHNNMTSKTISEKQDLIEIKLSQVALIEILEGSEAAINTTGELLSLFFSLFRNEQEVRTRKDPEPQAPPATSHSTLRSIKGSMFNRSRDPSKTRSTIPNGSIPEKRGSEDTSSMTTLPADSSEYVRPSPSRQSLAPSNSKKLQKRQSRKSLASTKRGFETETTRPSTAITIRAFPNDHDPDRPPIPSINVPGSRPENMDGRHSFESNLSRDGRLNGQGPIISATTHADVASTTSDTIQRSFPEPAEPSQSATFVSRRFIKLPHPLFPSHIQSHISNSLLLRIWLSIAALYTRASLPSDASDALAEAFKLVRTLETNLTTNFPPPSSSTTALETAPWGPHPVTCSVEELWADCYAARADMFVATGKPRDAMMQYESALEHWPDHVGANICLANILLDVYEEKIPRPEDPLLLPSSLIHAQAHTYAHSISASTAQIPSRSKQDPSQLDDYDPILSTLEVRKPVLIALPDLDLPGDGTDGIPSRSHLAFSQRKITHSKDPQTLDRLAARDRAFGMLESITKLGSAWDNSEAWFALARAYELSGMEERAKELLWWVVELEGGRGIRDWEVVGGGVL
ncbi:hypothetical protein MMC25_001831 [Agyrium rufum]|nr:hypothetical protein [Agyrium rufum]